MSAKEGLVIGVQVEQHLVNGVEKTLLVHRKGSTRAFPPHHPLIPVDYQLTGQPVLIGGTIGHPLLCLDRWPAAHPACIYCHEVA